MTDFIPVMNVPTQKKVVKKETFTEPRAETIALIRQFARYYNVDYGKQQKVFKRLIN
jgi:hypothetical protein